MHILSEFSNMTSFPTDTPHTSHTWSSKPRSRTTLAMEAIQPGSNMLSAHDKTTFENARNYVTKARRSTTPTSSSSLADPVNMHNGNGHGGITFSTTKSPTPTTTATFHVSPSPADFVQALKQAPRNATIWHSRAYDPHPTTTAPPS
eukprot:667726-Pyramimonas_sp.AAC.1